MRWPLRLVRTRWLVTATAVATATAVVTATAAVEPPYAQAAVDTTKATLGDPIRLRLRLVHLPESKLLVPDLVHVLADADIVVGRADSEEGLGRTPKTDQSSRPLAVDGSAVGYRESAIYYVLKPYALGTHEIPKLGIGFIQVSGDTVVRFTDPIDLQVVSVREEGEEGLRDIAGPRVIFGGVPLWLVGIIAAATVVLFLFALLWLLGRRKRAEVVSELEQPIDYVEEFRRIAGMGHLERGEFKDYYSLLAETLRRFLEKVVGIDALEKTTTEISVALRQFEEEGTVREVVHFLGVADLVKFARFIPDVENASRAPETAIAIVGAIESHQGELEKLREAAVQASTGGDSGVAGDVAGVVGQTTHRAAVDYDKV